MTADQELDPGIVDVVVMLRNLGFNPTDSGDGRSKPDDQRDFDVKHVACTIPPLSAESPGVDASHFLTEADRLQRALGLCWRVEASYSPTDGSAILLATKIEEPYPRHRDALEEWSAAAGEQSICRGNAESRAAMLYRAGANLWVALQLELGRR